MELQWAPTSVDNGPEVAKYKVTILADDGSLAETATTSATGYVPQQLDPADGPFSWYVQIVTLTGNGIIPGPGSWRSFSFDDAPRSSARSRTRSRRTAPSGTRVPHLEWEPVSGATTYEIWRALAPSTTYTLYKGGLEVAGYTATGSSVAGQLHVLHPSEGQQHHPRRR